jgi:hypothetical protein
MITGIAVSASKQLQRTGITQRVRAASASFHYARASRFTRQRAAAELRLCGFSTSRETRTMNLGP